MSIVKCRHNVNPTLSITPGLSGLQSCNHFATYNSSPVAGFAPAAKRRLDKGALPDISPIHERWLRQTKTEYSALAISVLAISARFTRMTTQNAGLETVHKNGMIALDGCFTTEVIG